MGTSSKGHRYPERERTDSQSSYRLAMAVINHFIFLFALWPGLLSPMCALAQDTPLFVQGGFEDATVRGNAYNAGGVIVVNGFHMNIPENLLVHFPEALVPWRDFAARKEDFKGFETRAGGLILPRSTAVLT